MFLRRKLRPRVNRSPHDVPPKVGLYVSSDAECFPCSRCEVFVHSTKERCTYSITTFFTALQPHFDVYFPVSECGHVEKMECLLQGKPLVGEVCRELPGGGLVHPGDNEYLAKPKEEREKQERTHDSSRKKPEQQLPKSDELRPPPPLYFFVVRRAASQLGALTTIPRGMRLKLEVRVRTINHVDREGIINIIFPLTTCPRPPAKFQYKLNMPDNIRRAFSPNRENPILPVFEGRNAEIALDITQDTPIHMEDYIFVLQVELGKSVTPQCADPLTILILTTAIGMMIFFALTRDLDD